MQAVSQGRSEGWDSAALRPLFVLAGVALVACIAVELRSQAPTVAHPAEVDTGRRPPDGQSRGTGPPVVARVNDLS